MGDPPIGITFRETMAGPVALGEAVPQALEIRVVIEVRDLDRFIADPEHAAALSGVVDFPPFGGPRPAAGRFLLFAPSDEPERRLMVYELAFRHEGRDRFLLGRKDLRDDPGLDLVADLTTLAVTVHEGRDAGGPAIGSGVLRIGAEGVARMLSTIRATNAGGTRAAEAVARFGRFVLGRLWATYG